MVSLVEVEVLRDNDPIEDDVYYMYPSHSTSVCLVMRGALLREWLNGNRDRSEDFALISNAMLDVFEVLQQVYSPEFIREMLRNWDALGVSADAIVAFAFTAMGRPIKMIEYGSERHEKLGELVMD